MIPTSKRIKWCLPVLALVFALAAAGPTAAQKAGSRNECVTCHTSGAKLIKLTTELHKKDVKNESLSEGPG